MIPAPRQGRTQSCTVIAVLHYLALKWVPELPAWRDVYHRVAKYDNGVCISDCVPVLNECGVDHALCVAELPADDVEAAWDTAAASGEPFVCNVAGHAVVVLGRDADGRFRLADSGNKSGLGLRRIDVKNVFSVAT